LGRIQYVPANRSDERTRVLKLLEIVLAVSSLKMKPDTAVMVFNGVRSGRTLTAIHHGRGIHTHENESQFRCRFFPTLNIAMWSVGSFAA
jgi:hypothetical protein